MPPVSSSFLCNQLDSALRIHRQFSNSTTGNFPANTHKRLNISVGLLQLFGSCMLISGQFYSSVQICLFQCKLSRRWFGFSLGYIFPASCSVDATLELLFLAGGCEMWFPKVQGLTPQREWVISVLVQPLPALAQRDVSLGHTWSRHSTAPTHRADSRVSSKEGIKIFMSLPSLERTFRDIIGIDMRHVFQTRFHRKTSKQFKDITLIFRWFCKEQINSALH